jgi:uncharacterized membrane protein YhaH (DUF805 family)
MEWMILPYKRYADFSGRSRRREFWMFTLFYSLVLVAMLFAFVAASGPFNDAAGTADSGAVSATFVIALLVFWLGSLIPGLAVQVRRFHDQGNSGWLVLLNLIPYLGSFIVLILMCIDGTRGDNSYGPDPKGRSPAGVFT